jgi:4-oxalocrotonate tautomerase
MPFVNIKMTEGSSTPEQKAQLIKGVTDLIVETLGKPADSILVLIEEISTDNWGKGGKTITEIRKGKKQ